MSEAPPPTRDAADFAWFERDRVVVVEGEVLASTSEPADPVARALLPPRSSC
ncbi:hypothetical protein [Saccharopolyspora sp. NPDC049357]|uniref:hypothetical protein n=1 Tax=Saccharopolyspora sp. NPDC049357 TaxID=3154507 RepID=UPI003432EEDE